MSTMKVCNSSLYRRNVISIDKWAAEGDTSAQRERKMLIMMIGVVFESINLSLDAGDYYY